ncbi:hypothetical protein GLOIN_2v1843361 [Rhizophagus irregularis DAOM 181602=DAOM 197198]|nr:hypothetical protein GLOIN_2v1843361 [Rhizophagus irregularis DAOM 181602=DAOM 197198]POG67801.1 hypothetical protein GLOIN_2v1843361 [Rhizophagus irregularis DAOM 181602=DAOM 197198]|eukprot:XP_025174667.1 hypothetical protein GLOIN_2v1843361 [Rhizophagus irregularis DAOM 181602=DAOM 197198]
MHHYKLEFKFSFKFNTKGGLYPISAYLIRSNQFFNFIKSLKNKDLFYINQIITADGLFLRDWKDIKKLLPNKKGRTPGWYQYLKDNIILNQNNLRLNFDLPPTNIHNPLVTRPKIIPQSTNIKRIKNIWIAYWCPRTNDVIFGRIVEKQHFYNHHQTITFEHFTHITDSHSSHNNLTPRSRPTYLTKCTGCNLSEPNTFNSNTNSTCYITSLSNSTIIINVSKSNKTFQQYRKPFYKCVKQYSTIKQNVIIDYNLRNTRSHSNPTLSEDPIIYRTQLENFIDLDSVNILNRNLITQLISPDTLHLPLFNISKQLSTYNNIEFYTDGSLNRDDDFPKMGYGWIFTTNLSDNVKFSGSCKDWPSSSKAELMAILTALITCTPNSKVQIYTDSASCIDTFNKLNSPKLTARRFQKLNNCTIWNTVKYIINTLKLNVSLIKVKAHSGNPLNDAADMLAKEGSLSTDYLNIKIQHINTQSYHLTFNDTIIIDRNIRKTTKRITNFQNFQKHLSHNQLDRIKHHALNNLIDWEYSQLWFKYNSFSKPTCEQYTKHVSWKIKCSSNNLPTMDILNRNYPDLIKENEPCFLCSLHIETNDHLWNCPQVLSIIKPIFEKFYEKFKTIITSESNSVYALYSDSITQNPIFKWTKKPPTQIADIPELYCLLRNFIPTNLTYPFKAAKISKTITKKLLLNFIFDLHRELYEKIWKVRATKWKQYKKDHDINKKSFVNYRRNRQQNSHHNSTQRNN